MNRSISKEIENIYHRIGRFITSGEDPRKEFNQTQFQIIDYLIRHEGEDVCQKDLEIETGLKKASITGTLDALVERDIVYREQSKQDKRKNYVRMTQLTLSRKQLFEERIKEVDDEMVSGVSPEDLKTFYDVLDQINKNINEAE